MVDFEIHRIVNYSVLKPQRTTSRFSTASTGRWKNLEDQRKFLDTAAKDLQIRDMSDWYKIVAKVTDQKYKSDLRIYNELVDLVYYYLTTIIHHLN